MKPFAYCAAIRTLGRAGHKYLRLLQSLQAQTQPPLKILVYLADDCPPPPETLGCETLVRVPRGMVAQRALPYDEVTTPYLLLLDDDLYLPPRTVEMLAEAIQQHDGDAVAVDVFRNHELPWPLKVRSALTNWALPRPNDGWAFKLLANGSFTYNNHPPQGACPSQTAAGAASLWRTDVLRALHLDHECWLDRWGFAYGEDLLHFRKLTLNGGRLLVHYGARVEHLDAATSHSGSTASPQRLHLRAQMWFMLWWRAFYALPGLTAWQRVKAVSTFAARFAWNALLLLLIGMASLNMQALKCHLRGTLSGWREVHKPFFTPLPPYRLPHALRHEGQPPHSTHAPHAAR